MKKILKKIGYVSLAIPMIIFGLVWMAMFPFWILLGVAFGEMEIAFIGPELVGRYFDGFFNGCKW